MLDFKPVIMDKIVPGAIKTPERQHSHRPEPARLHEGKVLLIKLDFLL